MAYGMTNSGGIAAYNTGLILQKVTAIETAIAGGGSGSGTNIANATIDSGSAVEFKLGGDNAGVYVATGDDIANATSYGIGCDSLGFYANTEG